MRRMVYGIGLFLAFLFLGAGFFLSYQVADLRQEMSKLQESSAQERQQVSTLVSSKDQELVFETYEEGSLLRNRYRITAYGPEQIVLRQEEEESNGADQEFLLKVENGCITVYDKESGEIFEHTNIPLETLPQELQAEVLLGKTLSGDQELYSFLENYSS